jgi:predicted nuclease of predicted toxin-antitoxin system
VQRAEHVDLIGYATSKGIVIVTRDPDFHVLIARGSLTGPSTILIRLPEFDPGTLSGLVHSICNRFEAQLLAGCLIPRTERPSERVRFR